MELNMFGAIYVGSYEVSLKVFEFTSKKSMHVVDHIRMRMDLGSSILETGSIDYEQVDALCDALKEFVHIMEGYGVKDYEAYASMIFHKADNVLFILNQIQINSGVHVKLMTNSQNRFMSYRTVAGRHQFEEMIQTSAAIIDVGGAAVQIMLFRNGQIVTTQDLDLGSVKLHSLWAEGQTQEYYMSRMEEYIATNLAVFRSYYLEENVEHIVFMNDYCRAVYVKFSKDSQDENLVKADRFIKYIDKLLHKDVSGISEELSLSDQEDELILPSLILFKQLIMTMGSKDVWIPKMNINDGLAQEYGQNHKLIKARHDFEHDVHSAACQLAKHYQCDTHYIEDLSVKIFDAIRKMHGLGKRERLLLRVAALMQDCGRYISLSDTARCSYNIIMSSEIIGLTYEEKTLAALTVLYATDPIEDYQDLSETVNRDEYLTVAKLSAILCVANALDQSRRHKFKDMRITTKGRELIFSVAATEDISLEEALFEMKTAYFETVFSMKPVLRKKRVYNLAHKE